MNQEHFPQNEITFTFLNCKQKFRSEKHSKRETSVGPEVGSSKKINLGSLISSIPEQILHRLHMKQNYFAFVI